MTYLLYKDENGWKIARNDGRKDKFTQYYFDRQEAAARLTTNNICCFRSFEDIDRKPQEIIIEAVCTGKIIGAIPSDYYGWLPLGIFRQVQEK